MRHGEDHREREKDRGYKGEEISVPSSGPVALRVWLDIRRVRIGVHQVKGLALWGVGELRHSVLAASSAMRRTV
jgi:hypothetical protein